MQLSDDSYLDGAREIAPLAAGVVVYGVAYGLLAAQAGFAPFDIAAMGVLVFAGGAQFVSTQQWMSGAGALASLVAGLALNLRLALITASIREVYAGRPLWRVALAAHLTTDENWAMMLARRRQGRKIGYRYLIGAGLTLMGVWAPSTFAAAALARVIPDPKDLGMDFAFTAAFIAISRSLFRGRGDIGPWTASVAVVVGASATGWIATSWALVLGGLAGAAVAGAFGDD